MRTKNILIIRSANLKVTDDLIHYLDNNVHLQTSNIYFLVQENSLEYFEKKCPEFNFFVKDNLGFNFNKMKNSELMSNIRSIYYDEIYIPSSYYHFIDFYQIFLIISNLKRDKVILYNCAGIIEERKFSKRKLIMRHLTEKIFFKIRLVFEFFKLILDFILKQ